MERTINEEKREKFIEFAGKRVNNVLHDIQILEPMARSNNYDFTRADVDAMFTAMQNALNDAKEEYHKKFDEKARAEKKTFTFSTSIPQVETVSESVTTSTTSETSATTTIGTNSEPTTTEF